MVLVGASAATNTECGAIKAKSMIVHYNFVLFYGLSVAFHIIIVVLFWVFSKIYFSKLKILINISPLHLKTMVGLIANKSRVVILLQHSELLFLGE